MGSPLRRQYTILQSMTKSIPPCQPARTASSPTRFQSGCSYWSNHGFRLSPSVQSCVVGVLPSTTTRSGNPPQIPRVPWMRLWRVYGRRNRAKKIEPVASIDTHVLSNWPKPMRGIQVAVSLCVVISAPATGASLHFVHLSSKIVNVSCFSVQQLTKNPQTTHVENKQL